MDKKELKDEIERKKLELQNKKLKMSLLFLLAGATLGTLLYYAGSSILGNEVSIESAFFSGLMMGALFAIFNYFSPLQQQDEYQMKIKQKALGPAILITLLLLFVFGVLSKAEFQLQTAVSLFIITFGGVFFLVYLLMKYLRIE